MTATAENLADALVDVVLPTTMRSGERFQAGIPQVAFKGSFLSTTTVIESSTSDVHPDGSRI